MSMGCKCKLITLGKINKYFLIIFSASVCKLCLFIFSYYAQSTSNSIINLNNVIQTWFYSLGLSLSVIIFIIYKRCNKSWGTKKSSIILSKRIKTFSKLKKFLWILLISVIDFIANILLSIINEINNSDYISSMAINIIIASSYSHFILKIKLYKHHYLCIIIFLVISVTSEVNSIIFNYERNNDYFLNFLFVFLMIALYFLTYILFKYITQKTIMKI